MPFVSRRKDKSTVLNGLSVSFLMTFDMLFACTCSSMARILVFISLRYSWRLRPWSIDLICFEIRTRIGVDISDGRRRNKESGWNTPRSFRVVESGKRVEALLRRCWICAVACGIR